jgi:hypothetical protein
MPWRNDRVRSPLACIPIVLVALALTSPAFAQSAPAAATPAGVRVESITVAGATIPAGRATAEFAVPLSAVESVINDFGRYHEFLPQVAQSRIVHRRHDEVELYLQVQLMRNLGTLWALTRFELQHGPDSVVAHGVLLDGNVRRFDLRIEAHAIPGSPNTRVSLMLLGEPSFFLPQNVLAQQQPAWAVRALSAMRSRAEAVAHTQHASR